MHNFISIAATRLVNIFNYLAFDWTVKDKRKVTRYDPRRDDISVSPYKVTLTTEKDKNSISVYLFMLIQNMDMLAFR
jgi:hypothetical protein